MHVTEVETRLVVGAVLYKQHGEVLLQQRDNKPGLRYSGYWTLFGGYVETGETPDQAIRRELKEELALELPLRFWMVYECPVRTIPSEVVTLNHIYVGQMTRDLKSLTLLEGQAMAYFRQEEALKLTLAFEQSFVLERFFREHPEGMI
jgi:ADP-ribose pyrophosphatase YjhB (NUDIX family)